MGIVYEAECPECGMKKELFLGTSMFCMNLDSRTELEGTIAHEMIHALMDESLTCGMLGVSSAGVQNSSYKFPLWFVEDMAQTAVGGYANVNDWVNGGLGINASSSENDINTALRRSNNRLSASTNTSNYGTGYLAVMYLGFCASNQALEQSNVTAGNISSGLDSILNRLISGESLDAVIKDVTNGTYTTTGSFANGFSGTEVSKYVSYLTKNVGGGNGSLLTGNFASTDLLADTPATSNGLFDLNKDNTKVTNTYPSDVTVLSGGNVSGTGNKPVSTYAPAPTPTPTPTPTPVPVIPGALNLQIGANAVQSVSISIDKINSDTLGISTIDVSNHAKAGAAIESCDDAITKVSTLRSKIGAYQNRMEHAIRNIDNTAENLQAAESRIRDLDIAKEMVRYSLNEVLLQAGQSVLAQANNKNEGILQLLR